MPFPKTKKPAARSAKPMPQDLQPKKMSGFPLFMCEFFEGFQVLQSQGLESKEYIWGLYFGNEYCGHVYFGTQWSQQEVAKICTAIMPPTWDRIDEYVISQGHKVWYWKMHPDQYAWVYERVITKSN